MRGYSAIGLHAPQFDSNIGGALRAAFCYGASLVVVGRKNFVRENTDTPKAFRTIPLITAQHVMDVVPYDCVPVAVDLVDGARSLFTYTHPERAYYVFGPENGTLGKGVLERCRDHIFIPMNSCSNLAATVNVVLYDRASKQNR